MGQQGAGHERLTITDPISLAAVSAYGISIGPPNPTDATVRAVEIIPGTDATPGIPGIVAEAGIPRAGQHAD